MFYFAFSLRFPCVFPAFECLITVIITNSYLQRFFRIGFTDPYHAFIFDPFKKVSDASIRFPFPSPHQKPQGSRYIAPWNVNDIVSDPHPPIREGSIGNQPFPSLALGVRLVRKYGVVLPSPLHGIPAAQWSHSQIVRFFFWRLQGEQEGARFEIKFDPPRDTGTIWSTCSKIPQSQ